MVLQALILVSVTLGAVSTASEAWTLGDIGVGLMAWLNIVGIIILQQPAYKALWDFEKQKKQGLDPTFDPVALGITGATFWENYDPVTGKDKVVSKDLTDPPSGQHSSDRAAWHRRLQRASGTGHQLALAEEEDHRFVGERELLVLRGIQSVSG